ncbi:protein TolQ [Candidatus Berkiella aquae]|uniref:Tol-Pal system protein TolQ n=1 Tax=Candidatus Berkiella aquae TaxID=295108 RepID=A0A0Q9YZA6_9GAMM|nr:protein TolQ [Candidatus Berkiella aquae]MCS5712481.1 protein TolQ [Candidatus Berkiella aquae]
MNTDLSLLSLFTDASALVKIVMLILLGLSIVSWTLIFQRGYALFQAQKLFDAFQKRFKTTTDLNRLYDYLARRINNDGVEEVVRAGFREFVRLYKQEIGQEAVMVATERAMRVALAREEESLEQHLPFLATVGSISVYIGLFGTVWGIMTAFRALGSMQQATLAMVAPGISEALVATALGLFAAIPAVFAYNRFSAHTQKMIRGYDTLAEEFSGALNRRLHSQSWQETSETQPKEALVD